MGTEYLSEVRDELQTRSTRTTLEELKRKGFEQVRVIRSSEILQLIERAVDRALAQRGEVLDAPDRSRLLENSQEIFRDMLRAEMQSVRGADQKRLDDLCTRLEQQGSEARALREKLAQRDGQLADARSRSAELDAELRVLRTSTVPAPAVEEPKFESGNIEKRLESLGAALASQIERIGRKVGVNQVEEAPVADISGLFGAIPDLESNLDAIEPKERKGSDVTDALARIKTMKQERAGGS